MTSNTFGALAIASAALLCVNAAPAAADTKAFDTQMQKVLVAYLEVHEALSSDSTKGVNGNAEAIEKAAKKLDAKTVTGEHAEHYKDVPAKITAAAASLAKAKTLQEARAAFKKLSRPMAMWASMSKPDGVYVVFCSMAKGSWLQRGEQIRNPYHGKDMRSCGEIVGGAARK